MQVAIDGCKRVYAVDPEDDIKRIRAQKCMNREKDYPIFFKAVRAVSLTKNGKERPKEDVQKDKRRLSNRIDETIVSPMNWLYQCLDKIQGIKKNYGIDNLLFLSDKPKERASSTSMSKVRKIVEEYDAFIRMQMMNNDSYDDDNFLFEEKTNEVISSITKYKLSKSTIYRLIETSFGYEGRTNSDKRYTKATKYTMRMLNVLYRSNKDKFLNCFKQNPTQQ